MRKFTAEIFGFFFLSLLPFFFIGLFTFGSGCAGSPPPPTNEVSESEVILFYSESNKTAGDESIKVIPMRTPLPDTITETLEYVPVEQPDILPQLSDGGSDYLISPYDVIKISVLGEDELSVKVRVSERGAISFPLLGEVQASGYTPIQFERRLEQLLEKDYLVSPSVNITILEYGTISVLGQVKKPGSYEIKGRLTVTQAIALAGGLTKIASPNSTKVIRQTDGAETFISIQLNDILSDGNLSGDIPLKPGDLIVVPESFF